MEFLILATFGLCVDAYIEYSDEVVKETEAVSVEGEAIDFPEMDVDGKDEVTLRDVEIEGMLVPSMGAPLTGCRVDRFPQGPGRMRLVSTPLWSWGLPRVNPSSGWSSARLPRRWGRGGHVDDPDAFAAQEERCPSWRRAKRGGVVACGVQGPLVNGDPAVSSDGAWRARRRDLCGWDSCRKREHWFQVPAMDHVFLELKPQADEYTTCAAPSADDLHSIWWWTSGFQSQSH